MIKNLILLSIIGFISISCINAYELTGDNLIEPRYYDGNLLIFNDGSVTYSIFSDNEYLGTINPNQGMYVNESLDYKIYASYSIVSDLSSEMIEKKINQYWYIALIAFILILFAVAVTRVLIKR